MSHNSISIGYSIILDYLKAVEYKNLNYEFNNGLKKLKVHKKIDSFKETRVLIVRL